jgi:hypothetical protein
VRYRVEGGVLIKTENAAKSFHQRSKHLTNIIESLPPVSKTSDYGCGKLRYLDTILPTTETLAVVDSTIQLFRPQMLVGAFGSINEQMATSNRITALDLKQFRTIAGEFDRGFCINVLSVIPIPSVRVRVIESIRGALKDDGTCMFVVQYRNSDFTRMLKMPNARSWRDDILINSLRGYSYYALIPPDRLVSWVAARGLQVESLTLNDGSAYLLARKPMSNLSVKIEEAEVSNAV